MEQTTQNIIINTESGKKLEIINEVNPYAGAQNEKISLDSEIWAKNFKISIIICLLAFNAGMMYYFHDIIVVLLGLFILLCIALVVDISDRAKLKKELVSLDTKLKNNAIEENIEKSIMSSNSSFYSKKERCFFLFELPNRAVLDLKVISPDGKPSIKLVMEKENGDIETKIILAELDHVEYNRRIEHIQITVRAGSTDVRLPFEYYL